MRWILNSGYVLRGWKNAPFFLEHFPDRTLIRLNAEEAAFLMRCDGQTQIDPEGWPKEPDWVQKEGIVSPAGCSDRLRPEQEYRCFPNRFLHYLELSVTERCNFKCKHCFQAPDTSPGTREPSFSQLLSLLDQFEACGVGLLRLDGGEPLLRKDFLEFTSEMDRRNIRASEIVTNGFLITGKLLGTLERQGHHPVWYVSFDGLGTHDWLRGVPGAEEKVLSNIKLLCDAGCYVHVHQCVWKDSWGSVRQTVEKLKELGVSRLRLTPVEPSFRWMQTAPEQLIDADEWQRWIPDFLKWWYAQEIPMDLDVWTYWVHTHGSRRVLIAPDLASRGEHDGFPACVHALKRPYIDAAGNLLPCIGSSGGAAGLGLSWGNVYQEGLQKLYTDSAFLDYMTKSCGQLKEENEKCRSCRFHKRCSTGCRAEAIVAGNGPCGIDPRICRFFENGTYEKLIAFAQEAGFEYE